MTPWGGMLQTAARLGVGPEGFWRMSLREWRMLTARPDEAGPPGRMDFERMVAAWPDDGRGGTSPSTASRSPFPCASANGEET